MTPGTSRRDFLRGALGAAGAALLGTPAARAAEAVPAAFAPLPGGTPLGRVAFVEEGVLPPGRMLGSGLAARRTFDLAALGPGTLITPTAEFFVHTAAPALPVPPARWTIRLHGRVARPREIDLGELHREAGDMGTHLVECAGNTRLGRFGLISTARWHGVPLARLLRQVAPGPQATRVLVSGFDRFPEAPPGSVPGASWIFAREALEADGAFLATAMNGAPLPALHGGPVRLVVPGWYGCTCIKWVNEIALLAGDAPATGQMLEYAVRTHQRGIPRRARDFAPARIDPAAMPVRVEAWRVRGRPLYRVIGILWGGRRPAPPPAIRFEADAEWTPVERCAPVDNATWTVWSHRWRPPHPGRYWIRLRIDAPGLRTRRLDAGFYLRGVDIEAA